MVVPRNLNDSTAVTEPFMMVSGGRAWVEGVSPEVHDNLHGFERVKLQVVKTAPDSQLLNLLSVSRLVTILISVVTSANFRSLAEGSVCSHPCIWRRVVGREHSPEELQC